MPELRKEQAVEAMYMCVCVWLNLVLLELSSS